MIKKFFYTIALCSVFTLPLGASETDDYQRACDYYDEITNKQRNLPMLEFINIVHNDIERTRYAFADEEKHKKFVGIFFATLYTGLMHGINPNASPEDKERLSFFVKNVRDTNRNNQLNPVIKSVLSSLGSKISTGLAKTQVEACMELYYGGAIFAQLRFISEFKNPIHSQNPISDLKLLLPDSVVVVDFLLPGIEGVLKDDQGQDGYIQRLMRRREIYSQPSTDNDSKLKKKESQIKAFLDKGKKTMRDKILFNKQKTESPTISILEPIYEETQEQVRGEGEKLDFYQFPKVEYKFKELRLTQAEAPQDGLGFDPKEVEGVYLQGGRENKFFIQLDPSTMTPISTIPQNFGRMWGSQPTWNGWGTVVAEYPEIIPALKEWLLTTRLSLKID